MTTMKNTDSGLKAVIFDMDGVLIDSEPFWQEALISVMKQYNIAITNQMCDEITGMRVDEVIRYFYNRFKWSGPTCEEVVKQVCDLFIEIVEARGVTMDGVCNVFKLIKSDTNLRIGLASSTPLWMIEKVLKKLEIIENFEVYHSAQFEEYGKPHPATYITAARKMGLKPTECIAIEDSFNGLLAAKSALMKTIVIPAKSQFSQDRFNIADYKLESLCDVKLHHLQ